MKQMDREQNEATDTEAGRRRAANFYLTHPFLDLVSAATVPECVSKLKSDWLG